MQRIALLLACYNHERYVREAVETLRRQSYTATDIILVDDGSTDGTRAILGGLSDTPGVRVVLRDHAGIAATYNHALTLTSAPYVAFLSSDDRWDARFTQACAHALDRRPEAVLCTVGCHHIDGAGVVGAIVETALHADTLVRALLTTDSFCLSATCFRRGAVTAAGGWDTAYQQIPDYDLALRVATSGSAVHVPELLCEYRWHGDNHSQLTPPQREQFYTEMLHLLAHIRDDPAVNTEAETAIIDRRMRELFRRLARTHVRTGDGAAARAVIVDAFRRRLSSPDMLPILARSLWAHRRTALS